MTVTLIRTLARGGSVLALILAASLSLAACDGGPSAVRMASGGSGGGSGGGSADATVTRVDHRQDPTPLLDGKPMWAANRQHSAEDNAAYHFKRDGESFGAGSVNAYVRTAQDFVSSPPAGSETLKRSNGDRLIYDPKGNVFAVVTSEGAPRALFKPKDGAAYWAKQKAAGDKGYTRRKSETASDTNADPQG